ncbi:NUDIX hydrolase [Gordonia sp. NPDC003424]
MDPRIRLGDILAGLPPASSTDNPEPAPAASVVLLRQAPTGLQAYIQMRATTMAFAGGIPAFPGGRIDPGDHEPVRSWVGATADTWAVDLGTDPADAAAVVVAAVRETFEESGYLLASPTDGTELTTIDSDDWRADRDELAQHRISLAEFLARRNLSLRSDWLRAWSIWVTPEFEPRRFHTWFLAARCPTEQQVLGVSRESTTDRWVSSDDALRAADDTTTPLLPPQYCTFLELHGATDLDAIFAAPRQVPTIRPALASDDDGPFLSLPDDLVDLGVRVGNRMYSTTKDM